MAYRDVYSTYLIVIRKRRWDVPVEMGLGEEALCKNVQKLRPPPRQRGVGRRMAPQSGDLNPTVSIGELSSCHAALTIAECDSASEPAGDDRASDSVGVGGTNLMPRLRPMVCVAAGAGAVVVESVDPAQLQADAMLKS